MSIFNKMVLAAGSKLSIIIRRTWQKTMLYHSEVHHCANKKLGSRQHRGNPLTNSVGHHGLNVG
jgi:hypothetical protein